MTDLYSVATPFTGNDVISATTAASLYTKDTDDEVAGFDSTLMPIMAFNTNCNQWVPKAFATANYGVDASGNPAKLSIAGGDTCAILEARGWVKLANLGSVTDGVGRIIFDNNADYNAQAYYKFTLASAPTSICLVAVVKAITVPIGAAGVSYSGLHFSKTPKEQMINLYNGSTKNRTYLAQYEAGGGVTDIAAGTVRTLADADNWYCLTSSATATRLLRYDDLTTRLDTTVSYLQATTTEYYIMALQGAKFEVVEWHLLVL